MADREHLPWDGPLVPEVTFLGKPFPGGPSLSLLRLDELHATVPGNKWFKLRYNLLAAREAGDTTVLTFGGPWSNHIRATAAACRLAGLQSTGIIRGEAPNIWSPTLLDAQAFGMRLHFVTREDYRRLKDGSATGLLRERYGAAYLIPEGGNNEAGIRGCREILTPVDTGGYSQLAVAVGTGTTLRGIAAAALPSQRLLGFMALKARPEGAPSFPLPDRTELITEYTFGGFARKTPELLSFMQQFRDTYSILLDRVYTAKMLYGLFDRMKAGFFKAEDSILAVHTGGLQGNRSLDPALGLSPDPA